MNVRRALIVGLLSLSTVAHAATDRDRWLRRLDNYAVYVGSAKVPTVVDAFPYAKAACICTAEGSQARMPGYVTVGDGVDGLISFCVIPIFDPDGALVIATGCADWVPLSK
jgi:hypothetical protein